MKAYHVEPLANGKVLMTIDGIAHELDPLAAMAMAGDLAEAAINATTHLRDTLQRIVEGLRDEKMRLEAARETNGE